MPVFYFHLQYDTRLSLDDEGSEFPTLSAAKQEARTTARDMVVEAIRFEHKSVPNALLVADDTGRTLHTFPFVAVLPERMKT